MTTQLVSRHYTNRDRLLRVVGPGASWSFPEALSFSSSVPGRDAGSPLPDRLLVFKETKYPTVYMNKHIFKKKKKMLAFNLVFKHLWQIKIWLGWALALRLPMCHLQCGL